ncbi:MAG TPA: metallophosphoesterase [Sphingobacteriaceae bacterium]
MSTTIDRRKFIISMGALAAALPLGASAFDFTPSRGSGFRFMLLGDLHYDKLEHHDMDYVKARYPNDIVQIENYSRITRDNFPRLMQVTRQKAKDINADLWLQLGDFVEGLCGSEELARKQTTDFISYISDLRLKRPFFVVKGNHDITGEGARDVYKKVVLPWQEKSLKKPVPSANATFVHKNARFVIFDCYSAEESLEWLKGVLAEHKEEVLFFSVHQPIVPYNSRANWHVFAKAKQRAQREELLNLLGEHRAIVLTAHLHKTSILTRKTETGSFVQVAIGSVIEAPDAPVRDHLRGVAAYNQDLLKLEPSFSPATLEERRANIEAEKPFITHFEYADFCGYATVDVFGKNQVQLSVFASTDEKAWTTVNLSELINV